MHGPLNVKFLLIITMLSVCVTPHNEIAEMWRQDWSIYSGVFEQSM